MTSKATNKVFRVSHYNKVWEMHPTHSRDFCRSLGRFSSSVNFVLVSPTVNPGEKEKVHLQHFVLTGCPICPKSLLAAYLTLPLELNVTRDLSRTEHNGVSYNV